MAIPNNVIQYFEEFENETQVIITHGLGYVPVVRLQIDDGNVNYDYILGMAEMIVNSTTITVNFTPYTVSGRITYE